MRRRGWAVVVTLVAVGVLFVAVFPTRTWLGQRQELEATEQRLEVLTRESAELAARVQRLNTDAEIERLAREEYNLVRPGEEAYAILPAPPAPSQQAAAPAPAEAVEAPEEDRGFWASVWGAVTFWE